MIASLRNWWDFNFQPSVSHDIWIASPASQLEKGLIMNEDRGMDVRQETLNSDKRWWVITYVIIMQLLGYVLLQLV